MTKPDKPSDFDWVTARAGCSPMNMFQLLKSEAQKNVEAVKTATRSEGYEMPVIFFDDGKSFNVIRRTHRGEWGVRFTLVQDEISVESEGVKVYFTATLTLDDNGECRFLVDGVTLDRWQVLRRSLELLFFAPAR